MTLLSTAQVADRLGVTRRDVQALIKKGKIPAQQVGRAYVVEEADLATYTRDPRGRPAKPRT